MLAGQQIVLDVDPEPPEVQGDPDIQCGAQEPDRADDEGHEEEVAQEAQVAVGQRCDIERHRSTEDRKTRPEGTARSLEQGAPEFVASRKQAFSRFVDQMLDQPGAEHGEAQQESGDEDIHDVTTAQAGDSSDKGRASEQSRSRHV